MWEKGIVIGNASSILWLYVVVVGLESLVDEGSYYIEEGKGGGVDSKD